jgi:hypothetical protein
MPRTISQRSAVSCLLQSTIGQPLESSVFLQVLRSRRRVEETFIILFTAHRLSRKELPNSSANDPDQTGPAVLERCLAVASYP